MLNIFVIIYHNSWDFFKHYHLHLILFMRRLFKCFCIFRTFPACVSSIIYQKHNIIDIFTLNSIHKKVFEDKNQVYASSSSNNVQVRTYKCREKSNSMGHFLSKKKKDHHPYPKYQHIINRVLVIL